MIPTVDQTLRAMAGLAVERLAGLEQIAQLQADNTALRAKIAELEVERDATAAALADATKKPE